MAAFAALVETFCGAGSHANPAKDTGKRIAAPASGFLSTVIRCSADNPPGRLIGKMKNFAA
jgi:hypothetical protein